MFNLMKKDKDKDGGRKEKKEKKEKKERMSAAELRSLEEMSMRRGFFNLNRSSKRESKTRLEISNPIPIKVASSSDLHLTDIDSDSNRGSIILDSGHLSTASSSDDLKGEEGSFRGSVLQRAAKFGSLAKQNSQMIVKRFSFSQRSRDESASETSTPSEHSAAPSPQVEVRTLEGQLMQHPGLGIPRPGPRSRVPELVTKRFPADLRLPAVVPPPPPALRELSLQRRPTGDFGFSLRRTTMLDRAPEGQAYRRVVHFAEPGAGTKDLALGLVPGDRLVEINGQNVENKSRDEIVEMIRQSGDSVRLKIHEKGKAALCRAPVELQGGASVELQAHALSLAPPLRGRLGGTGSAELEGSSKDSSGPPRSPQPAISPVPSETSQRAKSPEATLTMNGLGAASTPNEEAQGLSRKRVANAVRKVVSKVLPGEEEPGNAKEPPGRGAKSPEHPPRGKKGEKAASCPKPPPPPPPPPAPPKPEAKKEAVKDELSVGLRSLMSRGRGKDHKSRSKQPPGRGEKAPSQEPGSSGKPGSPDVVDASKKAGSPAKPETPDKQCSPAPAQELANLTLAGPKSNASREQQAKSPALGVRQEAKTEDQIAAEEAWYETEKVWLVHKDGFSLASQLKSEELSLPEGKVRVKLDHDGAILDVDEDDIEKANAPSCDRLEDLASLVYLNESSVLHTLRQRYGASLLHTYAGPSLLVLSPRGAPAVYSEKVMHMFKGCRREDMAPHIYAVAQTAYRAMLMSRQDQSIVLLGSSGSGKTTSFQHLVQYLTTIAGTSGSKVFSVEKWQALYTLLEAFGNSPTIMNGSATRFSQILSLDFDQAGQVASASIQTMLLEKLRVARRPSSEATFNVFYYLLACGDSTLRTELHLNHLAENNVFGIVPLAKPEEKQKAAQQFSKLQTAMKVLAISPEEQKACWLILASIYHLGAAGATKAGRKQFARHEWAQKAAYLLGCSLEELSSAIFKHQLKGGTLQRSTSFRQGPEESGLGEGTGPKLSAMECLEGMASGLYSELFTLLISLVNRALKSSQHSLCSMMIVDTPGFQNPERGGSARGASFEELCHNYAQDRLQRLFHERTFLQELERYKEENIELAFDDLEPATDDSVAAVDQASHQSLVGIPGKPGLASTLSHSSASGRALPAELLAGVATMG
ncbi:hypothetical protein NN561_019711 [Cricetulus griseus]